MPKIFLVGGVIRDKLLGLNSKDIDYTFVLDNLNKTVEEGFQEMDNFLSSEGFEIFLRTPGMYTIRAKFPFSSKHANLTADFVMARKEIGYIPGTRNPILALGTLEDDLIRRDFTLNAMAEDEDGNLIDLFNGQEDLKNGILRTPLDPKVTFMDDPLRILRAIRFSITKGFSIHDEAWKAMKQPDILEKLRATVSGERIREEVYKMMKHDTLKTIKLLHMVDDIYISGFLELIFGREIDGKKMWLKPTTEKQ